MVNVSLAAITTMLWLIRFRKSDPSIFSCEKSFFKDIVIALTHDIAALANFSKSV